MLIKEVKKLPTKERFLYWIRERESIRIKRQLREPWPWTDDEILGAYRFCNVRRMDDKVSQWLIKNWYKKNHSNSLSAAVLARQLNNVDSLKEIGFPVKWDPKKVEAVLNGRVDRGERNFSAAYMITGTLGGTKIQQIVYKVVDPIFNDPPEIDSSSMENTWNNLVGRTGIQSFMAGQVVADLRWVLSGRWSDKNDWAPLGPGSKRGLNRLYGFSPESPQKEQEFYDMLTDTTTGTKRELPIEFSSRLEAMDYQNCLCEWDKYERALHGQGRPKQLYKHEGNK